MSGPNPRKRAAPGAGHGLPQASYPAQLGVDQVAGWNGESFPSNGNNDFGAGYGMMRAPPPYGPPMAVAPAGQTRHPTTSRALVPTAQRSLNNVDWSSFLQDNGAPGVAAAGGGGQEQDNIEQLEEQALQAKRDAQAKRKQIPPFVQKLSSFLEKRQNEDLIRWSEKGDSFIVLDEDEFAKTLIPELFKHNNYASFVRQLNMYGFHKRVGLSDNSMRASERKNKSPSEYSNPYFRRGHPNLLWLINKPKGGSKAKKNAKGPDGEGDSEEDMVEETVNPTSGTGSVARPPIGEGQAIQRQELALIHEDLATMHRQNSLFVSALTRVQSTSADLYAQFMNMQAAQERNQNSINAILNFLSHLFKKSFEGEAGSQNLNEVLANIISTPSNASGTVVDLGDLVARRSEVASPMSGHKRARGLLPPIPDRSGPTGGIGTAPPTSRPGSGYGAGYRNAEASVVTELDTSPTDTTSPQYLVKELERNPQEGMMKLINNANANAGSSGPGINLPEVAANTPAVLSDDQSSKLVKMMHQAGQPAATPTSTMADTPAPTGPAAAPGQNAGPSGAGAPSSQPIRRLSSSPQPVNFNTIFDNLSFNNEEIEALKNYQSSQAAKINDIRSRLGSLSPSGRIPGLDGNVDSNGYFDLENPDIDQFLDSDHMFENTFPTDGGEYGFGNLGRLESSTGLDMPDESLVLQSLEETPTEAEIPHHVVAGEPSQKRRRMS